MAAALRRCTEAEQHSLAVERMIPDRFFYPLAALVIAALIGLAMVYPQGQGAPSPKPFRTWPGAVDSK